MNTHKFISMILLLLFISTMSGAPLLVHNCCGEVESVSLTFNHSDDCCEKEYSQVAIDAPPCCGDELIDTALKIEGFPLSISIAFISPLAGYLENWNHDVHIRINSMHHIASSIPFLFSSSFLLDRTDLCIFRI